MPVLFLRIFILFYFVLSGINGIKDILDLRPLLRCKRTVRSPTKNVHSSCPRVSALVDSYKYAYLIDTCVYIEFWNNNGRAQNGKCSLTKHEQGRENVFQLYIADSR